MGEDYGSVRFCSLFNWMIEIVHTQHQDVYIWAIGNSFLLKEYRVRALVTNASFAFTVVQLGIYRCPTKYTCGRTLVKSSLQRKEERAQAKI